MTTKTNTARKLMLTSPRKAPKLPKFERALKAKAAKKGITVDALREQLVGSVEQIAAAVPVTPGLESDLDLPTIGELVAPVATPANGKAKKAPKQTVKQFVAEVRAENAQAHERRMDACTVAAEAVESTPAGVTLDREPGRNWHHISIDDVRVGCIFKTSLNGRGSWKAQEGLTKTKDGDGRIAVIAASRTAVLDAFVAAYRAR